MITPPPGVRVYLACGYTDMRKGMATLAMLVQQALDQLPQLLVLGLQFRYDLLQHLLQDSRIVRQSREIDLHNRIMTDRVAPPPMTPS